MAKPIDGFLQTDGNAKVVENFEFGLARCKTGKPQFGLWILCDPNERGEPSQQFECSWSGSAGYEFPVYFALSKLQHHIQTGGMRRELPPSFATVDRDHSYVVHNLQKAAMSFDFTAWLVDAWMTMMKEGASPPLKVCFCHPDKPGQTMELHDPHSLMMFENVVRPMLRLIGAVEVNEISNHSKQHSLYRDVSMMARMGVPTPKFSASGKAVQLMKGYQDVVTITLRECGEGYWPHRDSNLEEWFKFAYWLKDRGQRVVFIRDTKYLNEPLDGWETCPAASGDLELRMAVYQQARCNCFVSNGPWNLALFSDKPWMMFVTVEISKEFDARDVFPSSKKGWWEHYHGVKEGEQFPWCTRQQRIVWENDTYERMKATWIDFFDKQHRLEFSPASWTQKNEGTAPGAGL